MLGALRLIKYGKYVPQLVKYLGSSLVIYIGGDAIDKVLDGTNEVVKSVSKPVMAFMGYNPDDTLNDSRSFAVSIGIVFTVVAWLIGKVVK